jgi:primase-polymerase (primpol)-like protein
MRLLFTLLPLFLWGSVVIAVNFPEELRRLPQWVLWKFLAGKATSDNPHPEPRKVPFWKQNRPASATDPRTWSDFARALDEYLVRRNWWDGLMFALTEGNGITFIDADNAYPSDASEIARWAEGLQTRFADTYQEASISDTGFHILCHARAPRCGQWVIHHDELKIGQVEVYDRARFVVMTGITGEEMPRILTDHQGDVERLVNGLDAQRARRAARRGGQRYVSFSATSGDAIPPGHRHHELVRRASHMWKAGMLPEELEQKLSEFNATLCGGHYPASHIRQIVRSAMRWSR